MKMKEKLKQLFQDVKNGDFPGIVQFIKFGLVGVSNTLISYGTEMLLYYVLLKDVAWPEKAKIIATSAIAFIISVTNSYYWNHRYVFKSTDSRTWKEHLTTYIKTMLCYGVTGLVISPVLKILLSKVGVPYWMSTIVSLVVSIPLNFVLNKFWAYNDNKQ